MHLFYGKSEDKIALKWHLEIETINSLSQKKNTFVSVDKFIRQQQRYAF